jgi:hypothetical protein
MVAGGGPGQWIRSVVQGMCRQDYAVAHPLSMYWMDHEGIPLGPVGVRDAGK